MPFCGCRQTFTDLFDNLDCAVAGFEQIYSGDEVVQVKRLVAAAVSVGLDGTAAQVIDGVCAFILGYAVILLVGCKLKFLRCGQFLAAGRSVRVSGDYAAVLDCYLAEIVKFKTLGKAVFGCRGYDLAERGDSQERTDNQYEQPFHIVRIRVCSLHK